MGAQIDYFKTSHVKVYRNIAEQRTTGNVISKHLMLKFIGKTPVKAAVKREFQNISC